MMRLSTAIGVGALLVLGLITVANPILSTSKTARQTESTTTALQVVIKQLPPENGNPPVEILEASAASTTSNEVQGFICSLKNNTSKNIIAYSLTVTTVTEQDGKESSPTELYLVDRFVQEDIQEIRSLRPIPPGGQSTVESSGPTSFSSNTLVKRLELSVDYVEFDDKTTMGPDTNSHSSQRIKLVRDGATKYKEWIVQMYRRNGRSVDVIVPYLQRKPLQHELDFNDSHMKQGAHFYRSCLLDLYNKQGSEAVEKYLNR